MRRTQEHQGHAHDDGDEEEEDDFIEYDDDEDLDEARVYKNNYSDFIRQLGFSRGPTSVRTYRELGGKMERGEEAALRALEREYEHADSRKGAADFFELTKEEARGYHARLLAYSW